MPGSDWLPASEIGQQGMRLHALIERLRDRQFLVPGLFIVMSLVLSFVTNRFDDLNPDGTAMLIPSTVRASRTLLATTAGAIITVAALVFSFTAVTVQLAASQYSPRVVQGFLRDRVQQAVVGVLMASFTFSIVGLATIGNSSGDDSRADWTASTAVVLAVFSAVVIVTYIDHITRRLRVDDTVRRIAEATRDAFAESAPSTGTGELQSWQLLPETESTVVRSETTGFVQLVDLDGLVGALPNGSIARLDIWTGRHVLEGSRLVTVWSAPDRTIPEESLRSKVTLGPTRTIAQDPSFGIRQLVDIALRALSPGINDPATAADVVSELAGCIRAAYLAGDHTKTFLGVDGQRLIAPHIPDVGDLIEAAYTPIRRACRDHRIVLEAMVRSLTDLEDQLDGAGGSLTAVVTQRQAVEEALGGL